VIVGVVDCVYSVVGFVVDFDAVVLGVACIYVAVVVVVVVGIKDACLRVCVDNIVVDVAVRVGHGVCCDDVVYAVECYCMRCVCWMCVLL